MREVVSSGPPAPYRTFADAVRAGHFVFVSGTTAWDQEQQVLRFPGDVVGQTRFIYEKIRRVLNAAGCDLEDVVMTRDYIVSTEDYALTADVRREVFREPFPAATGVVVAGLLRMGALIEIEAFARIGE